MDEMTTHDKDKIIAAAKEAGIVHSTWDKQDENAVCDFYAIAFEDGRKADKEDAERYRWLCDQNEIGRGFFHPAFAARNLCSWSTKIELDEKIDRARSTK